MPRNAEQKIKLLVLYNLLQKCTDEQHPMTTLEIVEELNNNGISETRQTVYEDIEVLNQFGYEVICVKGRNNRYFVGDRTFERPEIQIMLNAIGAAKFLTDKKTSLLTEKVAELIGTTQAEQIKGILPIENNKNGNDYVYYNIDAITSAILEKKKLSFLYFDYGCHNERLYRKDKERYVVNPLGMIYSGENFYLVCFHDKYGNPANYRIDRMENVTVEAEPLTKSKEYEKFDLNAYKRELFSMFAGEKTEISLGFPQDLYDIAVDRFGRDIKPVSNGSGYIIHTTVRVSKTFFAWITTFEGRVKILSSQSVRDDYTAFLENLLKNV